MAVLALTGVRDACAAALAPQSDSDPPVLADLVDALTPPALMLEWDDPWLTASTVAGQHGLYDAHLNVLCFAGRVEPGPGIQTLEELLTYTLARLQADQNTWPLEATQAPRRFDIGGIPTLGARLTFRVPVSVNGRNP